MDMVKARLTEMGSEGKFSGTCSALSQFCGYEGRAGLPSNFDADYCYSLGFDAAALIDSGKTGYIATIKNLAQPTSQWEAGGTPITMMMNMEERNGKMKPVIKKALVDLDGPVFKKFARNRYNWAVNDRYINPGPIQFFGPEEICDIKTNTLELEQKAKQQQQEKV